MPIIRCAHLTLHLDHLTTTNLPHAHTLARIIMEMNSKLGSCSLLTKKVGAVPPLPMVKALPRRTKLTAPLRTRSRRSTLPKIPPPILASKLLSYQVLRA
ncbi:predicted protein [Plenodomus lingam JN3]|uniref:Predicted protein n=1 Tax=Leptosphaeria maculans (strain JN3 / isolate v23.1.3 / race Av1-4-5-6-7-8) TaxID=985895 RepID=E4ZTY0_LEPMJ|nr:predicted protein [Plenodomus lingam JN3]CBX94690.1 predicted protein [Plenodomus lingam JN3]